VQTFRKRRTGLSATAGLSCSFVHAEVMVVVMCATLSLVIILFLIIISFIIRRYRCKPPIASSSGNGSSGSSSNSVDDGYGDALRNPSLRNRRLWQRVMSVNDR